MSPIDPIDPNDFDLEGLDAAADAYEKVQRASQRREARKLKPLIERLLARQPAMESADVLKELRVNYRGGTFPTGATFVREIGSICREVRDGGRKGPGGARRPKVVPKREPGVRKASNGLGSAPVGVSTAPTHAPAPVAPQVDRIAAAAAHPLTIYAGTFGGKVWIHTQQIRTFFQRLKRVSTTGR